MAILKFRKLGFNSFVHREQAIINVFDQTTYSVVNVFDLTLQVCPAV